MKIDLHTHSTHSDGKFSPKQLIDQAIKLGLEAIALTDHDNFEGLPEAIAYSRNKNIEFVPGIEFSADPKDLAKEIHIVGLFIDYKNEEVIKLIKHQKEARIKTNKKMIKKLNNLGYDLDYETIARDSNKTIFGRPEIANSLLRKYSQFKDKGQIFDELLGGNGKAFVKNESTPMKKIVEVIHKAGGVAILAHPAYLFDNAEKVIDEFAKLGGDGLEVDCPYNRVIEPQTIRDKFRKIAKEKNLLVSGGTDFHEEEANLNLGDFGVSELEFNILKSQIKSR